MSQNKAIMALFLIITSAQHAYGWGSAGHTALVQFTVPPKISVGSSSANAAWRIQHNNADSAVKIVKGSEIRRTAGALRAEVNFAVSVNTDYLALACGATDLLSDNGAGDKISLQKASGCGISLDNASAIEGDAIGHFTDAELKDGLSFEKTRYLKFRTNQGGCTGNARLNVAWELESDGQDKDVYSAHVKLYAMLPGIGS